IGAVHRELACFQVISSPHYSVVLDIPGFRSTIRPLIGGRPRFSRGLHSVGLVASVAFLGYIISAVGFSMDPQKVSVVLQWPRPSGFQSIQCFLGFANYYRKFIRNFSTLAK
ncbi:unnamed protein product, partial [Staurois parvus]